MLSWYCDEFVLCCVGQFIVIIDVVDFCFIVYFLFEWELIEVKLCELFFL